MRLHTSLDGLTIVDATSDIDGVEVARFREHGSRTHRRAYEVILRGSGVTGGQWGDYGDKTATWDEWGIFLGELYRRDPAMRCGSSERMPVYSRAEHFAWSTNDRYVSTFTVADQHLRHRWTPAVHVTGAYTVRECKCGAMQRFALSAGWLAENFPPRQSVGVRS